MPVGSGAWLGGGLKKLLPQMEILSGAVERLAEELEASQEGCSALLQLDDRGKPAISVCGLNECWHMEKFSEAVEWIGEHGGMTWRPDDVAEIEKWRAEFEKASKFLDKKIKNIKSAKQYPDGSWQAA